MVHRPLRRAAALSLGALLAFAGVASADQLFVDGDSTTAVIDGTKHLGDVAPGGTVAADVRFLVVCAGLQHIDANQSVVLIGNGGIVPLDGAIVSVSPTTLASLTTPWAADGQGCPDPVPSQEGVTTSHVVLRAPTSGGVHTFTVAWIRTLEPAGSNDANAFSRTQPSVNFTVRVVANVAPTLIVPASLTKEGNTTGGWTADWSSVSATDPEDSPDPVPTCAPPAGEVVPLGTSEVTCSVTDLAGARVSRAFNVTVEDTTPPTLSVPADISVTTSDPGGRVVTFDDPSASDVVDASPTVRCSHASGDTFGVGTTTVTCTATDERGNPRTAAFDVTVVFEAPPPTEPPPPTQPPPPTEPPPPTQPPPPTHAASATWLEPVAGGGTTFEAHRGRTLPIKVRLFVDGDERTRGDAGLAVTPCGGGSATYIDLAWSGGRWNHSLDTSMLSGACYDVGATIDGLRAGAFRLVLRGDEAAKTGTKPATTDRGGGRTAPDTAGAEGRSRKPIKTSR